MLVFVTAGNWLINQLYNPRPMDEAFDPLAANATSLPPQETRIQNGVAYLAGPAPFLMNILAD